MPMPTKRPPTAGAIARTSRSWVLRRATSTATNSPMTTIGTGNKSGCNKRNNGAATSPWPKPVELCTVDATTVTMKTAT